MESIDNPGRLLIWENCQHCAYKHLTAAYAAMSALGTDACVDVAPASIYYARAHIAIAEVGAGYAGNRALAVGCLAMAETLALQPSLRASARWQRLALQGQDGGDGCVIEPGAAAFAAANVVEAIRELPELGDSLLAKAFDGDGACEVSLQLRALVREEIRRLEDVYEIGGKK